MQIVGQKNNLELISNWKVLPNFIIIQGERHSGKTYLVKQLCKEFNKYYVEMHNGINDVRNLVKQMAINSNAVYHFKDFDKASIQAKNALLKITEETPAGNVIVITGSTQLSTLESRAIKITMSAYTEEEMLTFLGSYYLPQVCKKLYIAGINTPAKCMYYKKYEGIESLADFALDTYERISYINTDSIIVMLSKFSAKYDDIDPCLLFIRMLISNINYYTIHNLNLNYSYQNVLRLLFECKCNLEHNGTLNRKLLLYNTFYQIQLLGGEL